MTTSSYTLGSSLTNPGLSSVNFGLPQNGNSGLFSGDLNLASPCVTSAGSEGPRSYTPFTTTLLQHQQVDNEGDGPPSLVSVPSQDGSSVASTEQRQPVFSSSEATSFADLASKAANSSASGFGGIRFGSSDNKGFAGKSLFPPQKT